MVDSTAILNKVVPSKFFHTKQLSWTVGDMSEDLRQLSLDIDCNEDGRRVRSNVDEAEEWKGFSQRPP